MNYSQLSKHRSELMGMAIVGILFCHFKECLVLHQKAVPFFADLLSRGICGVDIFMVVSGIGVFYSFTKDKNAVNFYRKRLVRLLPPYFIIGGTYWGINNFLIGHQKVICFLEDLFFISFFKKGTSIFWFVPAIIIFYLVFPLIYDFLTDTRIFPGNSVGIKTLILLMFAVVFDFLLSCFLPVYHNITIMTGRFPAFILGVYFGYKSYHNHPCSIAELIVFPGIKIILHFLYRIPAAEQILCKFNIHYLDTLLALLLIEVFIVFINFVRIRQLENVLNLYGGITLEVYLFHMALLNLSGNPADAAVYLLVCAAAPTAGGFLLHKCLNTLLKSG